MTQFLLEMKVRTFTKSDGVHFAQCCRKRQWEAFFHWIINQIDQVEGTVSLNFESTASEGQNEGFEVIFCLFKITNQKQAA